MTLGQRAYTLAAGRTWREVATQVYGDPADHDLARHNARAYARAARRPWPPPGLVRATRPSRTDGIDLTKPIAALLAETDLSRSGIYSARRRARVTAAPRATIPSRIADAELQLRTTVLMARYGISGSDLAELRAARGVTTWEGQRGRKTGPRKRAKKSPTPKVTPRPVMAPTPVLVSPTPTVDRARELLEGGDPVWMVMTLTGLDEDTVTRLDGEIWAARRQRRAS